MDKSNDELIASITVNESNFNYIAKTGKINGSLLQDIRRILDEKAQPIKERKCYIQQKLDEANELLYETELKNVLIKLTIVGHSCSLTFIIVLVACKYAKI